jgi:hypothetical protein
MWVFFSGLGDSLDNDDGISIKTSFSGLALVGLVLGESSGRGLGAVVSLILGGFGGGGRAFAIGFLCLFLPTRGGGILVFLPFERGIVETCE